MKTSYFANLKNIDVPLSISQYPPKWYTGERLSMLAPPRELLNDRKKNDLSDEEYTRIFNEHLSQFDPREMYDAIVEEYGDDVTLLCYEKPGDFCHRRLVAAWFEKHLDVKVSEWAKPVRKTTLVF